jgi:hypothetical protein
MKDVALSIVFLASLFVWGCGSSAVGVQGKVVDGKGRPLSGIEVIARQKAPAGGRDRFETSTRKDGTFRFKHLSPASQYIVSPVSDEWKTSAEVAVQTGRKGSTVAQPLSLTVRFTSSDNGIITDSGSGLQWAVCPGPSMTWVDAVRYAETLSLEGGGWRLPTRAELKSIYNESQGGHTDPLFRINRNWVWTSEAKDARDAWFFNFENSYEDGHCKEWVLTRGRVLVVRPPGRQTS